MKNIKPKLLLSIALFLTASLSAKAQLFGSNDINYHSFRSPIATGLNPALFPDNSKFYVSLSRFDFSFSLPLGFSDVIMHDAEGAVIRLDSIMNKLTDDNKQMHARLGLNLNFDLIGFGFKVKNMYFTFGSGFKMNTTVTLPLNTLRLLSDGNFGEFGREGNVTNINLGDDNILRTQTYLNYSVGFAMKIPKTEATVGVRLNLLHGIQMVSLDKLAFNVITDSANTRIMATSDLYAYSSGIIPLMNASKGFDSDNLIGSMEPGSILSSLKQFIPKSMGFTFDLGAKYEWKNFVFSASILDVGPGIHWTQNPIQLTSKGNDTMAFEGMDLNRIMTSGSVDTGYTNSLRDSLMALLDTSMSANKFWYAVPTKVYLGASWSLNNMLRFAAMFHCEFEPSKYGKLIFRQSTNLSVHFNLFDWLELAAGNSFTFDGRRADPWNPAVSVSFNIGRVAQMFATVDYLSDFRIAKAKAAHVYLGVNIVGYTKPHKAKVSSYGDTPFEVE